MRLSLPKWLYGLVCLSRSDEAFLILMSSPGPGMGKNGPVLSPLPAFVDLCKQAEGYSPLIFWSVAEASHEQKAAPGDFRLLPPWMSLFWACVLALDKMLFFLG